MAGKLLNRPKPLYLNPIIMHKQCRCPRSTSILRHEFIP